MYNIKQVEKLTGIKPHVLRYWEEVVPCFSPQKDFAGRRIYSQKELQLIFRIKFLTVHRKMTAEEAGRQILREAKIIQEKPETFRDISETRKILADLLLKNTKQDNSKIKSENESGNCQK